MAHPAIRANAGKVAIERGPLVYCLEEKDNPTQLASLSISVVQPLESTFDAGLLGGAVVIEAGGYEAGSWQADTPYRPISQLRAAEPIKLKALPYYLWGNRGVGEMTVWIRRGNALK